MTSKSLFVSFGLLFAALFGAFFLFYSPVSATHQSYSCQDLTDPDVLKCSATDISGPLWSCSLCSDGCDDITKECAVSIPQCTAPGLASGGFECQNETANSILFAWAGVSGANTYQLEVCTNSAFTTGCRSSAPNITSNEVAGLSSGTTYWAHVRVSDATTCSPSTAWSSSWSCSTIAAAGFPAPTLVAPSDGGNTTSINPTLQWNSTGAPLYLVEVFDSSNTSLLSAPAQYSVTNQNSGLSALTPGQTYRWRVASCQTGSNGGNPGNCNAPEWSNGGAYWSFTVTAAPATVLSLTPADFDFGNVNVGSSVDRNLTLSHNAGSGFPTVSGNLNGSGPFSCVSSCTYALNSGESQFVTIRFSPTIPGVVTGTITTNVPTQTLSGGNVRGTGSSAGSPTINSVSASPASPNETQEVTFSATASDSDGNMNALTLRAVRTDTGATVLNATCTIGGAPPNCAGTGSNASFTSLPEGPFPSGVIIEYWAIAQDAALNTNEFPHKTFTVSGGSPPTAVVFSFPNPIGATSFTDLTNTLIDFLFTIALIVAPILLVIAGVIFMTAAGEPGRVKTARSMLLWTVIGFGIILIAKGLVEVLKGILGI